MVLRGQTLWTLIGVVGLTYTGRVGLSFGLVGLDEGPKRSGVAVGRVPVSSVLSELPVE